MLKKTKEYKDFSGFVADSGGQVRNIVKERSTSKGRGLNSAANNQSKGKTINKNLIFIEE